jgi:hypothetical protein
MTAANQLAVRRALEAAGVDLIEENGGVRRAGCALEEASPANGGQGVISCGLAVSAMTP